MEGQEPTSAGGDAVLLDVDADGVAVVTRNRPQRRNGWNPDMERRYFALLDAANQRSDVRAIVVTGAGKTFCPGVDSGRLDDLAGEPMDMSGRRSPASPWWGVGKPMIAAINGACAGMGLVQALLCDVRFASRGVRFTTAFARRGVAAAFGIPRLLSRIIGAGRAADLLLSGRVFDADEAPQLGVINRVVEPDELMSAAHAYASDLAANCSPVSLALIRHQLRLDQQSDFPTALRRGYRAMGFTAQGDDFREGIDGFLAKRPPCFAPLPKGFDAAEVTQAALPEAELKPSEAAS